ncbi:uncharacterized protein ColSpa_12212 [Colletotrichum spaethianum]|uniref:Uncharacterized protein n=1 Tax=Colletotrichum spaethianum TaxID=700344 RepID=A0AA37PGS9_9PEZI|nr:uncharacterized protein ColSpa_12212 [Colletotrichum spaethianum]GKT52031.1 hypothetical protein ColSpa_12212 [Colletotrichum spaethianum]
MEPRRTSSVYSDTFELDDLLLRLTKQADEQYDTAIPLLLQENMILCRKLTATRRLWRTMLGLVRELFELADQLHELLRATRSTLERERISYLANCTAF